MSTYVQTVPDLAATAEVVEVMARQDVTVRELADRSGLGLITLENRIAGRAGWNLVQLDQVADALGVAPWHLLGLTDVEGEPYDA
jgi:lambda repressor-like predicted transcriptional regulator